MSVKVHTYTIDISGTNSPLDGEHECNGAGLNWGEGFVSGIPFHGFPHPILDNKWHKIEYNHLTGEWAIDKPDEVSDDFLYFCQHGKYPEPKVDHELEALKKRNQQVNERKELLDEVVIKAKYYGGFSYDNSVTIQALLELAIELSPDTDSFCEACDDIVDRFREYPLSVIDNMPR